MFICQFLLESISISNLARVNWDVKTISYRLEEPTDKLSLLASKTSFSSSVVDVKFDSESLGIPLSWLLGLEFRDEARSSSLCVK